MDKRKLQQHMNNIYKHGCRDQRNSPKLSLMGGEVEEGGDLLGCTVILALSDFLY